MPTLDDIVSNSARITVTFASGVDLNIDYRPNNITRKTFADLASFAGMDQQQAMAQLDALIDLVIDLVKWWDLWEPDGVTMIALTEERLTTVPLPVLSFVITAIFRDIRPEAVALQAK